MSDDLSPYPVIAEFEAAVRRPAPLQTGMVAQLFGENGPAADAINDLGKTQYHDALVAVEMFDLEGEPMDGFRGAVRRPKPLQTGMVAQIYGENGPDADVIVALSLSKFADQRFKFRVRVIQDADGKDMGKKPKGPYSTQAQALWKSAFFRNPKVWSSLGTDEEFLAWIRKQKCCVDEKTYGSHQGDIVPMHVRRIAHGAGVALKPPFSAIPGCWSHHQVQTDDGESAVGGREFYEKQRIVHLQRWAWERLTVVLGYESMAQVPPIKVFDWASELGLEKYLPLEYSLAHHGRAGSP